MQEHPGHRVNCGGLYRKLPSRQEIHRVLSCMAPHVVPVLDSRKAGNNRMASGNPEAWNIRSLCHAQTRSATSQPASPSRKPGKTERILQNAPPPDLFARLNGDTVLKENHCWICHLWCAMGAARLFDDEGNAQRLRILHCTPAKPGTAIGYRGTGISRFAR